MKIFYSKKLMTESDSCEKTRARDLSIILETHSSGKSISISTKHWNDLGLYLCTALNKAVLPSISGLRACKGIVTFDSESLPSALSALYMSWIFSIMSAFSAK